MEPQWTKEISSNAICTTYYAFFLLTAGLGVISILGTIVILSYVKQSTGTAIGNVFYGILMAALAFVTSLFQYLVCSRALLGEQTVVLKKE